MKILFQDESLIVINKPAGLLTIRDGYNPDLPTVKRMLDLKFGRCWIVHRLDKETSGVLIVAKKEKVHRALNLAFENKQIHKIYHAIIFGIPAEKDFLIDSPLRINGDRRHRTVVDNEQGKLAKTKCHVLQEFENLCLLELLPETGYTHQIRAHLSSMGHPILGDKLYRNPSLPLLDFIQRTALHAFSISFEHPVLNSPVTITAPYPEDLIETINLLSNN
ncbi:MAG: RluA family pseudouridine synthase [Chloroflexi bacterium HGW-Chloroflexi-4]|jgi:RluA family pseudouridine synthase|nr:MAG: RluA family pseudouridine synthase [Chloroflexi bacterium HGW-Chloroflexi-4]